MDILTRYIVKSILLGLMVITAIILCLFIVSWMVGEVKYIGNGNYEILDAILYVLMQMPNQLVLFMPFVTLLGCIVGLGVLDNNNEIIIIRGAGYSLFRIVKIVVWLGALISILIMLLSEYVAPSLVHYAENNKRFLMTSGQSIRMGDGVWFRNDNSYIYISEILNNGKVSRIIKYDLDNNLGLTKVSFARTGEVIKDEWIVKDVKVSVLDKEKITALDFKQQIWNLDIGPEFLYSINEDYNALNLRQLHVHMNEEMENSSTFGEKSLIFWQRIFQPLVSITMMFLAIPIIFGSANRTTQATRIIFGIVIGFVFHFINKGLNSLSLVYQISPLIMVVLPIILFTFIAYVCTKKIDLSGRFF